MPVGTQGTVKGVHQRELMDEIKAIHQGGGNGSIIGRNCFQRKREDSLVLLDQMIQIYKSK